MNDDVNLVAQVIVSGVANDKAKVYALLLKNGVVLPQNTSDDDMAKVVSELLKKSKPFRKDFSDYVSNTQKSYSNMSGYSNANGFSYDPIDFSKPIFSSSTTPASTPASTTTKSSFWSTDNLSGLFNKGLDAYLQLDANATNKKLADASIARSQAGGDVSTTVDSNGNAVVPSSNTTLYVILGVLGIAVVGGAIWYMSKSKK